MKYKEVKEVIPLNGNVVIEYTQESKDAVTGETGVLTTKSNSLLKQTPIAELIGKSKDSELDAEVGDFVIFRRMAEVGEFILSENKRNLVFIHESNLIAKVK